MNRSLIGKLLLAIVVLLPVSIYAQDYNRQLKTLNSSLENQIKKNNADLLVGAKNNDTVSIVFSLKNLPLNSNAESGRIQKMEILSSTNPKLENKFQKLIRGISDYHFYLMQPKDNKDLSYQITFYIKDNQVKYNAAKPRVTIANLFQKETNSLIFPGGKAKMESFFRNHLVYPQQALDDGVEGSVFLNVCFDKDGSYKSAEIVKSLSPECDQEAIRLLKKMPKWVPQLENAPIVHEKIVVEIPFDHLLAVTPLCILERDSIANYFNEHIDFSIKGRKYRRSRFVIGIPGSGELSSDRIRTFLPRKKKYKNLYGKSRNLINNIPQNILKLIRKAGKYDDVIYISFFNLKDGLLFANIEEEGILSDKDWKTNYTHTNVAHLGRKSRGKNLLYNLRSAIRSINAGKESNSTGKLACFYFRVQKTGKPSKFYLISNRSNWSDEDFYQLVKNLKKYDPATYHGKPIEEKYGYIYLMKSYRFGFL